MKTIWLRFGCFLTGYNYSILSSCSEASKKSVKKYIAALLIISTIWGLIGYAFAKRYLHSTTLLTILSTIGMVVIIIQIERQIILSYGRNRWASAFRIIIGLVMACIGSIIIDQILLKDDIDKKQVDNIQMEVNRLLPIKTLQLDKQISQLDTAIIKKENERTETLNDINGSPSITLTTQNYKSESDTIDGKIIYKKIPAGGSNQTIVNPKSQLIPSIDAQIATMQNQKTLLETNRLTIRDTLQHELELKNGFLDELNVLISILSESKTSLSVWVLWFILLFSIELFVLVSKLGDRKNDYDKIIQHQMDIKIKMLEKLEFTV